MKFTEFYEIERTEDDDWFDPILTADTQLFVDPFRIYADEDERWRAAHDKLITFFDMVLELVAKSGLNHASSHWRAAARLLTFPEPPEFCLGYGVTPFGSGTGEGFGAEMLQGAALAVREGLEDVRHVEELALFAEGIQEDRISDIVCNVLKADFIAYTQEVAERHGLEMENLYVPHAQWDRRFDRWVDDTELLPRNGMWSDPQFGVILVPARFLRQLPTATPAGFWDYAWEHHQDQIRDQFNYDLGKNVSARLIIALARAHPRLADAYMHHLEETGPKPPYDLEEDPQGEVSWYDDGLQLAAEAGGPKPPQTPDEFCDWVREVLEGFAHNVGDQDGWILLWTKDKNGNDKPANERYAQALLRTAVFQLCRVYDVDFSGEPNAGRGPVDFKFSQGWSRRALAEVKRTNASRFWHGLETQTVEYMKAEKANCGFFVVIGFIDRDFEEDRVDAVRKAAAQVSKTNGYKITPIFVDARQKPSASKA